jgi:hypothetical protein
MFALVAMLLLLGAGSAGGQTLRVSIAVDPGAVSEVPGLPGLEGGLQRLFNGEFGSLVALEASPAASAPAVADAASMPAMDAAARVVLGFNGGAVTVSTDLTSARATRSLVSTVPTRSPASLLSTMAGDLAFLFFSSRGFSTLPLSPPPALAASLSIDSLRSLTGWNAEDLEPVGLAAFGDEVTLCFPHRYLTLGPLFRISPSTIRDMDGQGVGREPLQLSGVVAAHGDRLFLLSERSGRIAVVNPRLGSRQVVDAPGLSGLTARLLEGWTVAALTGSPGGPGVRLYTVGSGPARTLDVGASYVPAFDRDSEGNLWAWDAGERRVRVLTPEGREVFSVKPLFSAATMQLPQQLAVFDDGSFLLGGSAEIWKFQASGIPVWRLTRIPGRPAENLPSSFDLGINRATGSVTILDSPSRRLLAFASPPPDAPAAQDALPDGKAAGWAAFADGLVRDLVFDRAEAAYLRAAETLRELTAESPDDETAAGLLQYVLSRRREVRSALAGSRDVQVVSARLVVEPAADCRVSLVLEAALRNRGSQALVDVRVHVNVPSLGSAPALAALETLPAGQELAVRVPLGLAEAEIAPGTKTVQAFAVVTADRGQEGVTAALTFAASIALSGEPEIHGVPWPGDSGSALACRAVSPDTLAASLATSLLSGKVPDPPQPLADLAGILGALGAARGPASDGQQSPGTGMRGALRSLSPDEGDWTLVTASISSSLGLPAAILFVAGRPVALVDTRIPFFTALSAIPELQRFRGSLAGISPAGTLWIPLSGRVSPDSSRALEIMSPGATVAWSFADALQLLSSRDASAATRSELSASSYRKNTPSPFPLVLPAITARPSLEALRDLVGAAAAGLPSP